MKVKNVEPSLDVIDLLLPLRMFDGFSPEELEIVQHHLDVVDLLPGQVLFREGDLGDYVGFVAEGRLEVLKRCDKGDNVVITELSRGSSIGEMSIVEKMPRSATVIAKNKAILVRLSISSYDAILEEQPILGNKMLRGIARNLSRYLRSTSADLADSIRAVM